MLRFFFTCGYWLLSLLCIIIDLSEVDPAILLTFYRRLRIRLKKFLRRFCIPPLRPLTAEQKQYFWKVAAIATSMLVIGMAQLLFGCTKARTDHSGPVSPPIDSVRIRLEQKVATAKDTAKAAHQRTSQTQKPYENAAHAVDSLGDELLNQLRPDPAPTN